MRKQPSSRRPRRGTDHVSRDVGHVVGRPMPRRTPNKGSGNGNNKRKGSCGRESRSEKRVSLKCTSTQPGGSSSGNADDGRKTKAETMSSERKIASNRANARLSTGPKTLEGKAAAALNGIRHGLLSRQTLIKGE